MDNIRQWEAKHLTGAKAAQEAKAKFAKQRAALARHRRRPPAHTPETAR